MHAVYTPVLCLLILSSFLHEILIDCLLHAFKQIPPSLARKGFSKCGFMGNHGLYMSIDVEIFMPVTILSNTKEAEGLRSIAIEVPSDIIQGYTNPGQYVKIKSKDSLSNPSFFAIASPPDQRNIFSFLIKEGANNEFLTKLTTNDQGSIEMSLPMGRGYQIKHYFEKYKNDFPVTDILLLATGSGIAPIAAVLDSQLLQLKQTGYTSLFARKATMYYGCRTPLHLPYAHRFAEWKEAGVDVIPVISKPQGKFDMNTIDT